MPKRPSGERRGRPQGPKRRQLTVPDRGLKYLVQAAMADLPGLRERVVSQAIVWLVKEALRMAYRGRVTVRLLLAQGLNDDRWDWSKADDPIASFANENYLSLEDLQRFLDGRDEPTSEMIAVIAGALDLDVNYLLELAGTTLEENGHDVDVKIANS